MTAPRIYSWLAPIQYRCQMRHHQLRKMAGWSHPSRCYGLWTPRVTREHGTYERPSQEAKYLKSRGHVDAFWSLDYKLIWIHVVLDSMGYRPEWWKILRLCWWWWWHELDPMLPLKTRTATMQVSQIILRTCTWCNYTEEKWHLIIC